MLDVNLLMGVPGRHCFPRLLPGFYVGSVWGQLSDKRFQVLVKQQLLLTSTVCWADVIRGQNYLTRTSW